MVHLERKGTMGGGGGYLQVKIFYFLLTKNRENGKRREFGINCGNPE